MVYDIIFIASPFCGIVMVIGSMILLHKGIITLSKASADEAISIEFKKIIKVNSHYPAIALFILGAVFVFTPMIIMSNNSRPLAVDGQVYLIPKSEIHDVRIKVLGGPWDIEPDSDGSINGEVTPSFKKLKVEIDAPGRPTYKKTLTVKDGSIILGEVDLGESVINRSILVPKRGNLTPLTLPSINSAGQGGME
jgi:hypothetical protein